MYKKGESGLEIHTISSEQYIREKAFGFGGVEEIKSLGRIEKIMASPLKDMFLYQGQYLSCVSCACSWANQFNSVFNSNGAQRLSWRDLYIRIGGGKNTTTRFDDTFLELKNIGQPRDVFCPNFDSNGKMVSQPLSRLVTDEIIKDRDGYRINNFFFLKNLTRNGIFNALKDTVVVTGAGGNNSDWSVNNIIRGGEVDWYHAFVIVDVVDENNAAFVSKLVGYQINSRDYGAWVTIQAWKEDKLDVRLLDKNYSITVAATFEDLPDNIDIKNIRWNMGLIRNQQNGRIYFVDSDNKKHHIDSEEAFVAYFGRKAWETRAWIEANYLEIEPLLDGEPITLKNKQMSSALAELIKKFGQSFGWNK